MNNVTIEGRAVRLVPLGLQNFNEKANVLVKNLDKDVTQQALYELFSAHGNIQSCKLENYQDGSSRGFAYVQFENEEQADAAIAKLNGYEWEGGKKLEVSRHEKKEQRTDKTTKFNNLFV